MPESWSSMRKRLEQDFLCDKLKGRVQYFRTNYHGAPDDYGRFAVRIDGREVFMANPYNEVRYDAIASQIRDERNIPRRVYTGKEPWLYDEENTAVEAEASLIAISEGNMDSYEAPHLIKKFFDQDIATSIGDNNPFIRMLAVLDRRTGKRALQKIKLTIDEQPQWLQTFYKLRLDAEGIKY